MCYYMHSHVCTYIIDEKQTSSDFTSGKRTIFAVLSSLLDFSQSIDFGRSLVMMCMVSDENEKRTSSDC